MWECPTCHRTFASTNQYHICSELDVWDIFEGRADDLLLAFDSLMNVVLEWDPCQASAAKKTVVFSTTKAWLIVRPMKSQIDLKFYLDYELDHPLIHKITPFGGKLAHQIRISTEDELTPELYELLRLGHAFAC